MAEHTSFRTGGTQMQLSSNTGIETSLSFMPAYFKLSFNGIQNSSKLRALFAYGLPCIYSGVTMIDPKTLTRLQKLKVFTEPAPVLIEVFDRYPNSFIGMEAKIIDLIKERAKANPQKTVKEILNDVRPVYARRLRKKQAPIFHELVELAQELPLNNRRRFDMLMADTEKKLNEKPVLVPFSSYEFKYKLAKIRDDIENMQDVKSKKVMNKLIKESKRFSNSTSASTIQNQKDVLWFLEHILKKSVLKNNLQLKSLISTSKSRLNKEEIIVPFTRKTFIYDLAKVLEDLPNKKFQEEMLMIAQKLPTSQESFSAYVLKISTEQPDKIGHRIIWPSLASVEHLLPRSEGGEDIMANFAGATTRENSLRKSIKFTQQMKRRPLTPLYCQKNVDRLIELYHQGVFARQNINPKYISDFANTVYVLSEHRIKLDLSKMACA
jgi:hypothetical protein